MANKRDYYEVLEISKTATQDEIKKSYRMLAKKYHPDVNKAADAESKFKEINEAYEVLSDPNKRANYDRFGHQANGFNQGAGFDGFDFQNFSSGFGGFEDIFGDIFSGFGSTRNSKSNTNNSYVQLDIEIAIQITFQDVINGVDKKFKYERKKTCPDCQGTGAVDKKDIIKCTVCNGKGRVINRSQTLFGFMSSEQECYNCQGTGTTIKNKCKRCNGRKYIIEEVTLTVNIPIGTLNGAVLTVSNKGNEINNKIGNLYLHIKVKQSNFFEIQGHDIYTISYIDPLIALVGGKTQIVSPYGEIEIDVPANTRHDDRIKVSNKGLKYSKKGLFNSNSYGDLYVIVRIAKNNQLNKDNLQKIKDIIRSQSINDETLDWNNKIKKEIK